MTAQLSSYDNDIFTTVNSTHLTIGGSKVAKMHTTIRLVVVLNI